MLEAIRQKKENLFYTLILVAIIFVMMFVYGSGKVSKSGASGAVVAWVNGEAVTQQEFQQELQYRLMQYQQMLGAQYDEKLISAFKIPESTLESIIRYKLLAQQAKQRGFLVSDSELADKIRSLPYFQKDGKFDSEQYLKLPNRGLEENRMRTEMETSRWQTYLLDRVRMTPEQLKRDTDISQAKMELAYAKLDFASLAPNSEPSAKDIEEYSKNNASEIKSYYDSHIKEFSEPAAVLLRKIRVGIPFQASDSVKAASKKKVEEIQKEVTPANFESIAKSKSDDEFAKKGGLAGWINRGTLEKPLEEALNKLKVGEVSPLIETPFGYFILKIDDKKDEKVRPLDEVKNKIVTKLAKEKAKTEWASNKRKELEKMLAAGQSIESELKKWKVDIKKTGTFNIAEGNIPGIGQVDSILDGALELTKSHPVAKKLFYSQDHFYFVKLVSFETAKPQELAKNQEASEKKIVSSLQRSFMESWQESLKKKASIDNELVAKSKNSTVSPETAED